MNANRDPRYIDHILECIERINEYVQSRAQLVDSRQAQDAVLRNLQVLSESVKKLSHSVKKRHPEIPWREIIGFRNVIVHDYFRVDIDNVWGIIEQGLPSLERVLSDEQSRLQGTASTNADSTLNS